MTYTVDQTKVARAVERLSDSTYKAWNGCLAEISEDPHARFGYYVDQIIPIRGFPMRTWTYEIAEEISISGEIIFVFTGDFLPECSVVYVVNEEAQHVLIIHLRANYRA